MISIEKALGIYTEKINNNEKIDLKYFESELKESDYIEFLELIKYVKLAKAGIRLKEDKELFEKFDKYKNEYYAIRKNDDKVNDKEAMESLNRIFEEVFRDDE